MKSAALRRDAECRFNTKNEITTYKRQKDTKTNMNQR